MSMQDRPIEAGIQTLIGADEQVGVNNFSATLDYDLGQTYGATQVRPVSGEIQSILLVSSETGTGAVQEPTGWLFFMDADPNTTTNDAAITAAERATIIAQVEFFAADWDSDANGATAYKTVAIPFHSTRYLYTIFRNEGAAINDVVGDDEIIQINLWYRRDD